MGPFRVYTFTVSQTTDGFGITILLEDGYRVNNIFLELEIRSCAASELVDWQVPRPALAG